MKNTLPIYQHLSASINVPQNQWRVQDFPDGGVNFQDGGANPLFGQIFPENCIKMKEIRTKMGGGAAHVSGTHP